MDYTSLVNDAKNGLTLLELEEKYGYCKRHVCKILKSFGITTKRVSFNRHLSDQQKSIIMGSLLGDACITVAKSGKCRIRFVHGPKQYEYLNWKYEKLKDIVLTCPKTRKTPKAYGKESRSFITQVHDFITELHNKYYKNNKKSIDLGYLNKLDSLSVAVWFMDDGYLYKNGGSLSTHCFSYQENRLIAKFLSFRYDVNEPKLSLDKRCNKFCIRISTELSQKIVKDLQDIIKTVPSMEYKVKFNV